MRIRNMKHAAKIAQDQLLAAETKRQEFRDKEAAFLAKLASEQKDLPAEFAQVINDNFWELL